MRFIIIGGGGFGLELYTYISCYIQLSKLPKHCTIGVLDEVADLELMAIMPELNYLGRVKEFV
jgi:hypothetical protein